MTEYYQVYVGNLPTSVSKERLDELFSTLGDVRDIWINPIHAIITYAFVSFDDLNTCNEACKRYDNYELDFFKLKVRRSFKCIAIEKKKKEKGILIELPKRTGMTKSHTLKKILCKNLRQNPDIHESFKMAIQETEYLTDTDQCEVVKHGAEQCNLETLEETIIRNFKKPRQKKPIPVDIDLTKGKFLSVEQNEKMFNLQFSLTKTTQQQRQQQQQTKKKRIPFALDYRGVCDDDYDDNE